MSIINSLTKTPASMWLLACFMVISFSFHSEQGDKEYGQRYFGKKSKEFNLRDGFRNFFRKTTDNDTVTIAYLGGSITAAPGWRVLSFDYFKKQHPDRIFREVNAAIGGTGSEFGAYRLDSHVLKFKPDLVFVEFAVNDTNVATENIIRSMEGIVRQIWADNPGTDICFIYTIRTSFITDYLKGQLPLSVFAMEEVASNYEIPSINFAWEVTKSLKDSTLIYKGNTETQDGLPVFSKDGVHPNLKTGHRIYHQILERSFESAWKQHEVTDTKTVHTLTTPMDPDHLFTTKLVNLNQITTSGGWSIYDSTSNDVAFKFRKYLPRVAKSSISGDFIKFKFKGKSVGILDIMGPGTGKVIIEVDHIVTDTISRFDKYCTYYRTNYFLERNLKDAVHEVKFTALAAPFDKQTILSEMGNTMDNPQDYMDYSWYLGQVMIDGELLE